MAMYLCNGGKSGGRACVADFDFTTGTSDSSGNNFKITVGGGASRDSEGYHLNNYNSNIKVTEFPGWSGLNFDIELDFGDYNIASPYANNVFVGFSGVNGLVYKNGYGFGIMTSSSTNPSSYASDTNINTFKNSTMRFVANGRNSKSLNY